MIERPVERNAVNPRGKLGFRLPTERIIPKVDKDLLSDIAGAGSIVDNPKRQRENFILVALHQDGKRVSIAILD